MPTQHIHRLLILIPAARRDATNLWVRNNLDSQGDNWFTFALSTTGNPPPVAYWCNAALTPPELRKWMIQLCQLSGISQPTGWDGWTRQQRKQWFGDQREAIRVATGIRMRLADNDGDWDDPQALLAQAGLQVIR